MPLRSYARLRCLAKTIETRRERNEKRLVSSFARKIFVCNRAMHASPAFVLPISDDDDDSAFLSAVDAAEADGLRSRKQHRLQSEPSESAASSVPHSSSFYPQEEVASKRPKSDPEGEYLAALRGNHSKTWQAMNPNMGASAAGTARYGRASYTNPGASMANATGDLRDGHGPTTSAGSTGSWGDSGQTVPDRSCPCGAGTCRVLTANTEKNAGRQFYRCPLRKEEGQCAFFEWCDTNSSPGLAGDKVERSKPPELICACGAGPCSIFTAKTEKNLGRQFYKCPSQGEGQCGFFKWCDDAAPASGPAFYSVEKNSGPSGGSPRQCYRCGLDGHWSNDCPNRLSVKSPTRFGSTTASGASINNYKYGQVGHWSKDCADQEIHGAGRGAVMGSCNQCGSEEHLSRNCPNAGRGGSSAAGRGATSGSCFTCGGEGHWASNCPNAGSGIGRGTSPGTCYNCGTDGHWAKDCPNNTSSRSSGFEGQFHGSPGGTNLSRKTGSCYKCGSMGHWANECPVTGKGKGRGN